MFKKKYYLFIENTREFNLNLIKIKNKFNIIYRSQTTKEAFQDLRIYRKNCKKKGVNFFVANDIKLLSKINADGLYISAYNKNLRTNTYLRKGFKIIGAAHNQRELDLKIRQGCKVVIFSRLFKTDNPYKKGYLGVQRFNILSLRSKVKLVPLGGINEKNLSKLNIVLSQSFACLSAIKKKPAKIINRLF
tara:strand:+ start:3665 stop:4234 length:570 start_codon:yes stop_codon:yes gene_type:complete